jgi:hypothetical protein
MRFKKGENVSLYVYGDSGLGLVGNILQPDGVWRMGLGLVELVGFWSGVYKLDLGVLDVTGLYLVEILGSGYDLRFGFVVED